MFANILIIFVLNGNFCCAQDNAVIARFAGISLNSKITVSGSNRLLQYLILLAFLPILVLPPWIDFGKFGKDLIQICPIRCTFVIKVRRAISICRDVIWIGSTTLRANKKGWLIFFIICCDATSSSW